MAILAVGERRCSAKFIGQCSFFKGGNCTKLDPSSINVQGTDFVAEVSL